MQRAMNVFGFGSRKDENEKEQPKSPGNQMGNLDSARRRSSETLETRREWVTLNALQPVDTVTRTVEVPITRYVEKFVPQRMVEEEVIAVPKYEPEYIETVVEVPQVRIVEKVVEVPEYRERITHVPEYEIRENIIERPVVEVKYIEKVKQVPQIKEVVRYQDVETVEEIIRYIPRGTEIPDIWKEPAVPVSSKTVKDEPHLTSDSNNVNEPYNKETRVKDDFTKYGFETGGIPGAIEQVFRPQVVNEVEIKKQVPVAVDVPVPYVVPKPIVVPVQVPVLKFRDHYVPIPVRRRIIPRIKWTNEIYQVECIKEVPYLQIQDIIKPVPCDVQVNVHEFVHKANPINPAELSQADIHAMWMRTNADLAEEQKTQMGTPITPDQFATVPDGETPLPKFDNLDQSSPFPQFLHPGHPLNMAQIQHDWLNMQTTETHEMYTPEWFEKHRRALFQTTTQLPAQAQLSAEQAVQMNAQSPIIG